MILFARFRCERRGEELRLIPIRCPRGRGWSFWRDIKLKWANCDHGPQMSRRRRPPRILLFKNDLWRTAGTENTFLIAIETPPPTAQLHFILNRLGNVEQLPLFVYLMNKFTAEHSNARVRGSSLLSKRQIQQTNKLLCERRSWKVTPTRPISSARRNALIVSTRKQAATSTYVPCIDFNRMWRKWKLRKKCLFHSHNPWTREPNDFF